MGFFNRFRSHSTDSAQVAKQRLQLVLAHDRSGIPPETLDVLKDEIINVISKHVEIDRAHVDVTVSRNQSGNRLIANIPVLGNRPDRSSIRGTSSKAF